jgi:hypothetical protein
MGEFFWVFELEVPIKSSKKFYISPPSFNKRMKLKMLYRRLLKLKEDI